MLQLAHNGLRTFCRWA